MYVATWEGFDNTNAGHHLENLSGTGVGPLFKTELQQILPTTGNNDFSVKDAAYMDSQEKKSSSSSSDSGLWDSLSDGAHKVSKSLGKGWDNLKKNASNWWNDAKKFVGD